MMGSKKAVLLGLCLLLVAGAAVRALCAGREGFTGSLVKNPDEYLLDAERMNGTDLHTLELRAGDALRVRFETVKGSMYMEIKAPDGTSVYMGNGRQLRDFTVNIQDSGMYTVLVEARRARGSIYIQLEERTQ